MSNILSQDEVDSLLNGIGDGKVETETDIPEESGDVDVYDFRKDAGPLHLRMPTLGIINERLIGFMKNSLSTTTGTVVDVNISDVETVKFGEFCRSLPLPTSLNIFKLDPLRGYALLVMEGSLVFAFVDTFFGGKSVSHVKLEGKSFTAIESKIINRVAKVVLKDLEQAWADVYKIKTVFTRSEIDPQFAGIATPDDMVIAAKLNIDMNNFSGNMIVCLPYATIEPIRDHLSTRFQSAKIEIDHVWCNYIQKKISEMSINVNCTLGQTTITGQELLALKVDDVIQLDQKTSDPVMIHAEHVPKFTGYIGSFNNKKALKIATKISRS
jgi:flagellar motor switch protein FliM